MNKIKKLVLGLSIAVTMAIAFVVGIVGLNPNKAINKSMDNNVVEGASSTNVEQSKPLTHTYAPNQVEIVEGTNTIHYEHKPDTLSNAGGVKAYEYVFGSVFDETMAVNLKYINTTDVDVSYVYSTSKLNTAESVTGETTFNTQTITTKGSKIYIYVIVSPKNAEIPATFTQELTWWFGKLGTMTITNPTTNQTISKPVVAGQEIDEQLIRTLFNISDEDVIKGFFYDSELSETATNKVANRPLYINVGKAPLVSNLPSDWLTLDGDHYVVTRGTSELPAKLIIPGEYNGKPVTQIATTNEIFFYGDYCIFDDTNVTSLTIPNTITSLPDYAFSSSEGHSVADNLQEIIFEDNSNLISIGRGAFSSLSSNLKKLYFGKNSKLTFIGEGAFESCNATLCLDLSECVNLTTLPNNIFGRAVGLTSIILPDGLTSIGSQAFYYCSGLTSIDLSRCTNLTSIGTYAFYYCSGLTSITLPSSLTSIGDFAFDYCSGLTDVYYAGSKSDFAKISIGSYNDEFNVATKHYNYTNG